MAEKAGPKETLHRSETLADWQRETVAPAVARGPLRNDTFETSAEIPLPDLFSPPGASDFPGEYPFLRGIQPTMYRGRLWTMRQYAGFGNAAQSNARYKFLRQSGQTGLSVAFDLPTQMGRDSDHALARGEVGRTGVAICSIEDMRTLFEGLPLDEVSTSMTINATAATLLALYVAVADERGIPRQKLSGTIQNDILKEYIARGTYVYPPVPSMRLVSDVFAFCRNEVPRWNTISISGYHIREAGSDAVQEVAFTLADGIAYVEAAERAGLAVDTFAPRLSFFFNAHSNLLEEVAKFRAARRLWATIMRERFKAQDPRSCMLRFHAQTAGSTLTASQPLNNVVRTTVEAMAAILGGAQSLHANGFDEALSLPTEDAAQLALRTQQVLAHESGLADVVDPFGGSHAVEALTDTIEASAAALIQRIDDMGGMLRAIEAGFPQREIEARAYAHQRAVEQGRRIIVGENAFQDEAMARIPALHRQDPAIEREQRERLSAFRSKRNAQNTHEALAALATAARGTDNLMPPILLAVKAEATLGEIADALRSVFGTHH
ncbi:MAG: methylmalonyl-CoA mutase family protein [Deltaproteobacteria bacterium]|nr:methylmalonyl-CoA mutase family protein [Deltaproteobacteria bacterium]